MRFFPPVALVHLLGCISQSLHDFPGDSVAVIDVSPILLHVSSKQDLMDCVAAIDRALSVYGAFVAIGVPGIDEEAAMKASAALFSSDQAALNEVLLTICCFKLLVNETPTCTLLGENKEGRFHARIYSFRTGERLANSL